MKNSRNESNQKSGYIKLFRSVKNHWLWKENRTKTPFEAWIDLMIRACHSDLKEPIGADFITVKRGQILTSQLQLSKDWFWSRKKVTSFLKCLEKDQMLVIECTTKWSKLTICNYESYQDYGTTKEQQKNNKGTSEEQQRNTYNNYKELEGIKNIPENPFDDDDLNSLWRQWIQHRKQKKEPLTQIAAERQISKLKAHSSEAAKASIEKSIERNWTGLFFDDKDVATVSSLKVIKAVGIAPNEWIQYEDGSIYPPLSPHDFMEYKAGRLQLSHFDKKVS